MRGRGFEECLLLSNWEQKKGYFIKHYAFGTVGIESKGDRLWKTTFTLKVSIAPLLIIFQNTTNVLMPSFIISLSPIQSRAVLSVFLTAITLLSSSHLEAPILGKGLGLRLQSGHGQNFITLKFVNSTLSLKWNMNTIKQKIKPQAMSTQKAKSEV